jgi:hypothetical protein
MLRVCTAAVLSRGVIFCIRVGVWGRYYLLVQLPGEFAKCILVQCVSCMGRCSSGLWTNIVTRTLTTLAYV